jgi:hypothetical protein
MKDNIYTHYQKLIKDKDRAVMQFIDNTLAKTQSMFVYEGLPDTLPQHILEDILQRVGYAFLTKHNGDLYAFTGGVGGEPDVYGRPTTITVANPALTLNKTFDINKDGVLIKNDTKANPLLNIIGGYAVLMTDAVISINLCSVLTRIPMLISASDDTTKESAEAFIDGIINGDYSIIGENAFFKGVTTHNTESNNSLQLTRLIELIQYYKASLLNEIGLNANYNMKRERLNTSEVNLNIDTLLPYVDNMLAERKRAIEKLNEMYDTDITVELASTWQITHGELIHDLPVSIDEDDDTTLIEQDENIKQIETQVIEQVEQDTGQDDEQVEHVDEQVETQVIEQVEQDTGQDDEQVEQDDE